MNSVVVDTHSAVWYLERSSSLSARGLDAINSAAGTGGNIFLASISLVEIIYLIEKSKLKREALERLVDVCSDPSTGWTITPLDANIVRSVARVARDMVPDMPDRIIAATALHFNLPLVTRDGKLRASGLTTIW